MIEVVPATLEHAARMAPIMRAEDSTEVLSLGFSNYDALRHSIEGSFLAEAAIVDGEVGAMWGACAQAYAGNKAFMWMLGTDHVPRNVKALLRGSRSFVAHVHQFYPVLECLVDMRYEKACRWIAWMGFKQLGVAPMNGVPFALCQREA
jgi:hypothetical protein